VGENLKVDRRSALKFGSSGGAKEEKLLRKHRKRGGVRWEEQNEPVAIRRSRKGERSSGEVEKKGKEHHISIRGPLRLHFLGGKKVWQGEDLSEELQGWNDTGEKGWVTTVRSRGQSFLGGRKKKNRGKIIQKKRGGM